MTSYAVHDYGVLIFDEDLKPEFLEQYEEESDIGLHSYSEFQGEAYTINEDVFEDLWPEDFFFGAAKRQPMMFKTAYSSFAELKVELSNAFGKFVKDDFNWEARIVELLGTVYG
ncbi:MAG: hypothetical protein FWD58_06205 [Firmicutes bacterium]|nr:hypothetical protein [Bacillota bacterium]